MHTLAAEVKKMNQKMLQLCLSCKTIVHRHRVGLSVISGDLPIQQSMLPRERITSYLCILVPWD